MNTETDAVELVGDEVVGNVARSAVFAALISAFAMIGSIPVPLSPVPLSLQPLAVFLAGLLLGAKWGTASMALYLTAGAVGAPIFAGGAAGIGVLFGPTGGYLWAYPLAAFLIGVVVYGELAAGDPTDVALLRVVAGLVAAAVLIYGMGVVGLLVVESMSLGNAVVGGALVFVPGELVKMAAAVGIVRNERLGEVLAADHR